MSISELVFEGEPVVTFGIAASALGISRQAVEQAVGRGKLCVVVAQGQRFVTLSSLRAWRAHRFKRGWKPKQPRMATLGA